MAEFIHTRRISESERQLIDDMRDRDRRESRTPGASATMALTYLTGQGLDLATLLKREADAREAAAKAEPVKPLPRHKRARIVTRHPKPRHRQLTPGG
jgi:hypothetical protein